MEAPTPALRPTPARDAVPASDPPDWPALLAQFGIQSFRPGQQEVIETVLRGEDCICVMPTGGGKSLCYQLPAICRPGVCLVVSPLIALMKDQVDQLQQKSVRAELINSTLDPLEQGQRLRQLRAGELDLLYVAPERFRSQRFREALRECHIQLLAIDEAHCISEWGHEFRHDYSRLGEYRAWLGGPPTIALTATATEDVRQDIATQLGLHDPRTFVAGFARPNLHYEAISVSSQIEKQLEMEKFLAANPGAGIIYAASRRACEEVAVELSGGKRTQGRRVDVYHAGLPLERRKQVHDDFMSGRTEIILATNAFGMGINKPDVRFVIHYQIPGSLEAYYQEAGRAGRDGGPARCLLLLQEADRYIQEFFIESTHPSPQALETIYEYLRRHQDDPIEMTQQELQQALNLSLSAEGVGTCERILEKQGALERLEPRRNMAAVRLDSDLPSLLDLLPKQARVQRQVMRGLERLVGDRRFERLYFHVEEVAHLADCDLATAQRALRELRDLSVVDYVPPFRGRAVHLLQREKTFADLKIDLAPLRARRDLSLKKLDGIFHFARSHRCRQVQILRHFGETTSQSCGNCDNCDVRQSLPTLDFSAEPISQNVYQATLMVLSGVARCRGTFGKNIVAGMLCGSQSKKILQWGLDQLTTFGLLRPLRQRDVVRFIDELCLAGLLETVEIERNRPTLRLTPYGDQVMRGREAWVPEVRLPPLVLEQLVACVETRQEPSANPGTTSDEPAEMPDQDAGSTATRRLPTAVNRPHFASSQGLHQDVTPDALPSYHWTWRLLKEGYTDLECSLIRNQPVSQIWADAMRAGREGYPVSMHWLLTVADQLKIHDWLAQTPSGTAFAGHRNPIPPGLSRDQIDWYLQTQPGSREEIPAR